MTAERFSRELKRSIETQVFPALHSLLDYVQSDFAKVAPDAVGLKQYPGGHKYYIWLVKNYTTLDVTAEVVHDIG
jgi:uncharacterized protein (DUF885 family)